MASDPRYCRSHKEYEEKRVVVIGLGDSGSDVAVDLCGISKQVRSKSL